MSGRMIVETDYDVAFLNSCTLRGTVLFHADDKDSGAGRQAMAAHQQPVYRGILTGNSDVAASDPAVFDQTSGNELCRIDCGRETYTLSRQDNGCIDADY